MGDKDRANRRNQFSFIVHRSSFIVPLLILLCLCPAACKREERGLRVEPPSASRVNTIRQTELQPGPPIPAFRTINEYEENAFAVSEGQRLYNWYNCVGCHSHGGGGIGPPLMDDLWIYGSDPAQVFSTIVEGRPNGMPSFRGKVPDYQIWQLTAYVRSMSGHVPKDVAPGREDDMSVKTPEAQTAPQPPKPTGGVPKSAERPK
jgi:cytochrome c oxidase cbb3-type subunit 3